MILILVKDYTVQEVLQPLIQESFPHPEEMIAKTCIAHLVGCGLPRSQLKTVYELRRAFDSHPLLGYAYENARSHIRSGIESNPQLMTTVDQFIQQCESFPVSCGNHENLFGFPSVDQRTITREKRSAEKKIQIQWLYTIVQKKDRNVRSIVQINNTGQRYQFEGTVEQNV